MLALIVLFGSMLLAQTVQFEEASFKLSPPRTGEAGAPRFSIMTPGRVSLSNVDLKFLVGNAYRIPTDRVSGNQDWIYATRYDLNAIYSPELPRDQVHEMLKALLKERLGLMVHIVQKESSTYALIVVKRGARLKPAVEQVAPGKGSGFNGHITGQAIAITSLASMISRYLDRPVIDETRIEGQYDIDLKWAFGPQDAPSDAGPSIFTALTEQLGLQLRSQKSVLDYLVIDAATREPSEQ